MSWLEKCAEMMAEESKIKATLTPEPTTENETETAGELAEKALNDSDETKEDKEKEKEKETNENENSDKED